MDYMFCNFLGSNMPRGSRYSISFVEVDERFSEIQFADLYRVSKEGKIGLKFVPKGSECDGEMVDFIGKLSYKMVGCSDSELVHTDENPLIVIATKGFKVHKGVPTYVKYLPVDDGVIVALIKGHITVVGEDGGMIPLTRNYEKDVPEEGILFGAEELANLNILKDMDSGVEYKYHVINDCIFNIVEDKKGDITRSYRFNKENLGILDEEVFIQGRLKKEYELKREAEKRLEEAEKQRKFMEMQRLKKIEEANAKAKTTKTVRKKAEPSKKEEKKNVTTGSDGAKDFLNYINSMKAGTR